jgi:hypothetical protein
MGQAESLHFGIVASPDCGFSIESPQKSPENATFGQQTALYFCKDLPLTFTGH